MSAPLFALAKDLIALTSQPLGRSAIREYALYSVLVRDRGTSTGPADSVEVPIFGAAQGSPECCGDAGRQRVGASGGADCRCRRPVAGLTSQGSGYAPPRSAVEGLTVALDSDSLRCRLSGDLGRQTV